MAEQMIKEEVFRNAKLVDLFIDLTEEEKEEAEFLAKVEMMLHEKKECIKESDAVFEVCKMLDKRGLCKLGPLCPDAGCREVRETVEAMQNGSDFNAVIVSPKDVPVTPPNFATVPHI